MRRLVAWSLLVGGLLAGLAGVALLTVLAPPDRIEVTTAVPDPGVAVVTAPGLLGLSGPDATVSATAGDGGDVFVAVGRAQDVTAWLGDARRTTVTAVTGSLSDPAAGTRTTGTGTAADPRAADLWLATATGEGTAALTWPTASDDDYRDAGGVVALVATDGVADAPASVRLGWAAQGRSATHPAGLPLVVAGGVLALLGALGLVLTPRRTPRRRA
ncbi:hypothetical protein [Kineococcus sp. SYSU DK002]|uniref:hypothetical protein n=1 Tax=Kineococcus sp. SYSU DK002 TaxID=3383123 RepID=UPI003D7DE0BF